MSMTIHDALDDYWDTVDRAIAEMGADLDYEEPAPPDTETALEQARARLRAGWLDRGAVVLVPDCMAVVYSTLNDAFAWARDTLACRRSTWSIVVILIDGRDGDGQVYRLVRDA